MGTIIEFNDLKAPDPVEGKPPWQDPQWLAAAEDWIDAECARAALTRIGPAWGRGRPYSVVARVPTTSGTVWFKANPPAARFEPALLVALAEWHPDRFAAPIAVDLDRAWSLTRDGGVTLRTHQSRAPEAGRWPEVPRGYARLQADLARHADDLLSLGLADLRPGSVPGQFEKLLGIPHIESVVSTPFDWGDAAVAHPFSSLLVALRTAAEQAGLSPRSPEAAVLTASYLSPWLEAGYERAAVDRSLSLALRIAPLARALTWGRLFPCYLGHPAPAVHAARARAALLEPDPLGPGPLNSGN